MEALERFEKNKNLVLYTINTVVFGSVKRAAQVAKNIGCELDDLDQTGYMELWRCCANFEGDEEAFASYAIKSIRFSILDLIRRKSSLIKYDDQTKERANIESMDHAHGNSDRELHEVLPMETNVEKIVINKITLEERLSILTKDERNFILAKLKGRTAKQIQAEFNFKKPKQDYLKLKSLKKLGVEPNQKGGKKELFVKMYQKGVTQKEIMKKLNFTSSSFSKYKKLYIKNAS